MPRNRQENPLRFLYTLLFYLLLPVIMVRLLWRARFSREYPYRFRERFGFCRQRLNDCICIHAVSLGETIAATPLIQALLKNFPDKKIVVTNTTATGVARTIAVFGDRVEQICLPYDMPGAVKRFLDRIKPRIFILMETELWPNLLAECHKRKIPVILANARLSEKSFCGYQSVGSLTKEMLASISLLATQGEADKNRFLKLGMPIERIHVAGSLKFDLTVPENLISLGIEFRKTFGDRFIWIAASTHSGEDEIMLVAHTALRKKNPHALLILVPRHPERFDSVASLIQQHRFTFLRRSENKIGNEQSAVYLADTVGEMMLMYAACDVACVAGSFVTVGGHNMIESAALKKPVIMGPSLFNFAEIGSAMIEAGGLIQVKNAVELADELIHFMEDEKFRLDVGNKGYSVVLKNQGALQRLMKLIELTIK